MNTDDFEKDLQRQPLRSVPAEWRQPILEAARASAPRHSASTVAQPLAWWRELLWPCPQAWAGLAAVWLVILFVNGAAPDSGKIESAAQHRTRSSTQEIVVALEQRRWRAELLASLFDPPPVEEAPRPRSERPLTSVMV